MVFNSIELIKSARSNFLKRHFPAILDSGVKMRRDNLLRVHGKSAKNETIIFTKFGKNIGRYELAEFSPSMESSSRRAAWFLNLNFLLMKNL